MKRAFEILKTDLRKVNMDEKVEVLKELYSILINNGFESCCEDDNLVLNKETELDEKIIIVFSNYEQDYSEFETVTSIDIQGEVLINNEWEELETVEDLEAFYQYKTPIAILNTTIATTDGTYEIETITLAEAKTLLSGSKIDSAIGHQSTASVMTTLLDVDIIMNRQQFSQQIGQQALVFKLKGRPEEGKILSSKEIKDMGYEFKIITRTK